VVFGTHFSTNGTGGYMEVFSISGLTYEIPSGQTGSIEYSGNTIPINFIKGNGAAYSPNVLILNSDNISSGRRKLGMLVYVYEFDQVYQYDIPNYEQLWTAATASTNCVVINEFGTTVRNNTIQGQAFINAWTASTIEGINGVVRANARWKKYWGNNLSVTGGSYNGITNTLTLVNITGGTVNITGFSGGGGGGGGGGITGGTFNLSNGDLTLSSSAGTITVTGFLYGSGTTNTLPKYVTSSGFTDSQITDDGTNVTIGGNLTTVSSNLLVNQGVTATTISATTYFNLPISAVTGSTGISATTSNGTVTITNTAPDQTVTITGGTNIQIVGTYPNFGVNFTGSTTGGSVSGAYLPLSGGTVTGGTIFQSGLTANTISATTYQNLPQDVFVTGGTYTAGSATFTNTTGGTFTVTGFAVGGGGGQTFYLNLSQSQGGNRLLSTTASTASEQTSGVTINNGVTDTIASFQSQPLNITLLPGGIWSFYLHSYKENNNASFNIFVELYKRTSGGTQTLLFATDPSPVTTNSPNPSMQLSDGYFSGTPLSVSDSIVAVVRATNTGNQSHIITLVTEGSQHYSYAVSTIPTQQGLTCDTLSGCSIIQTIQTDVSNKLDKSGGTVTGPTNFTNGLTANTISATTYENLPSFNYVQITGTTQFSAGTNNNLNFSGINITITSGSNNTLIFSAGTGGGGGGGVTSITTGAGLSANSTTGAITIQATATTTFGVSVDGSGGVITTGQKGYVRIPYNFTITSWTLIGFPSGSITFDIWRVNNAIPTVANTIIGVGGTKPSLTSSTYATSSTLTNWTATGLTGDVIGWNVDSATTTTIATLQLFVTRTS
jgi:hypothetical protein